MKIYIIPVAAEFQPTRQSFCYPPHNNDWDVEQDFLAYLRGHPELLTTKLDDADWAYLPIFWTRWHMSHDYAQTGREALAAEVTGALALGGMPKAFTVCLYEDGPLVDIGDTVLMTATRKPTTENGIDIPTLCAEHPVPHVEKMYRASFVGRLRTNPMRYTMAATLAHRSDVLIQDGDFGQCHFIQTLAASRIALCPTGGAGSFRFYEAMQLGVVPLLIHELDVRPFNLEWEGCSFHLTSTEGLEKILDMCSDETLLWMGQRAQEMYHEHLAYGKWCPHALEELDRAS